MPPEFNDGLAGMAMEARFPALFASTRTQDSRMRRLYEGAKQAQWNASTDIDWSLAVPFGEALQDGSAHGMAMFQASPLADRGRPAWDAFRWEVQSWMVCQFLYGEQAAMLASARLTEVAPTLEAKLCAVSQAGDEARHTEVFGRYVDEHIAEPYQVSAGLRQLFADALSTSEWDLTALALQCLVEPLALAGFRLAETTFHDSLIKQIVTRVARDEARHVSFGVLLLRETVPMLSSAELAHREGFLLDSCALMLRRFLLGDIWERFQVSDRDGVMFAQSDPGLRAYRQVLFSRVVPMLSHIGLLTPRVLAGLERMDLLREGRVIAPAPSSRRRRAPR